MRGSVLLLSNDNFFYKITKVCFKNSGLPDKACFYSREFPDLFKTIEKILENYEHATILIEKYINGRTSLNDIKPLQEKFKSNIKVIVVTTETDRNTIALMHETGADNVIVKPASFDTIIEKIALTLSPNNKLDKLMDACSTALLNNNIDQSEKYADKILAIRPGSGTGLMLKGDIYFQRNDLGKSEYYYTKAVLYTKYYLEPLKKLANFFEATGNIKRKLTYLTRLDNLSPLNRERKLDIANSYLSLGDKESALNYFNQAVKLAKREANEVLSKTYMDICLSLRGKDDGISLEYNSHAINAKKKHYTRDDVWMFNEKGIALRKIHKNKEAIEVFKEANKISPEDPVVNYNLGMAYAEEKEVKLASRHFSQALIHDADIASRSSSVAYNIGITFYNDRKFYDAYKMFKTSFDIDPSNKQVESMLEKSHSKIADNHFTHDIQET